jgi:hypothetical protein
MLKHEQLLFPQPNPILRYEGEGCRDNPIIYHWGHSMLDEHRILRPDQSFRIIIALIIASPDFARWPAIVPAAFYIAVIVTVLRALVLFPD